MLVTINTSVIFFSHIRGSTADFTNRGVWLTTVKFYFLLNKYQPVCMLSLLSLSIFLCLNFQTVFDFPSYFSAIFLLHSPVLEETQQSHIFLEKETNEKWRSNRVSKTSPWKMNHEILLSWAENVVKWVFSILYWKENCLKVFHFRSFRMTSSRTLRTLPKGKKLLIFSKFSWDRNFYR